METAKFVKMDSVVLFSSQSVSISVFIPPFQPAPPLVGQSVLLQAAVGFFLVFPSFGYPCIPSLLLMAE
jgi:hypothetical protein